MPVMRRLHVGGTTYDTVGEASVTQVQTSGTKIATVSIDGTATDIYAPAGGSSVDPATAAPSMDGTAAVGSSAKYAREDHVHPTDTSRQATLVSGTNIKTVMGASLLGSGNVAMPTASTSTLGGVKVDGTTITAAADGTISASGGGGGGWTDITEDVEIESGWSDALVNWAALSDGKSVIVTGQVGEESEILSLPSALIPFEVIFVSSCSNSGGSVTQVPFVEGNGGGGAFYTGDGTSGEVFTVTYVLASAVS